MKDFLSTMLDLGLGVMAITKEKAEAVVDELIKQGQIGKEEGSNLIEKLVAKGKQSEIEIQKKIEAMIKNTLRKYDVPTREEIDVLKKEIDRLKKQIKPVK